MQNVEFKAELRDIDAARAQCRALKARHIAVVRQVDTYFRLPDGRLKRREVVGEPTEWIFYHRPNRSRPALSNYTVLSDEQARIRWGTTSLHEWLTVTKTRDLWILQNIRIHIDEVAKLGMFLEFEAMVSKLYDVEFCHRAVNELRDLFAPVLGESISVGYSDLIQQQIDLEQHV